MDHEAVLAAFDRQLRRTPPADSPGARVERVGSVVRQSGAGHVWNGVLWSDLAEDTADEAIAAQVAHFGALGVPFEWKLYAHDRPADLADRLLAAGFVAEPAEALMVAEADRLSADPVLPEGVRLVPVTDAAGVDLLARVHDEAFGRPSGPLRQRLLAQLAETPDRVAAVVAMAGEVPVSAARMELPPGRDFAGLWGGGTVAGWRGMGVYRALVAQRARIAAARGYRYLQVDASDESRPILRRLGFATLSTTTPYVFTPPRLAPGAGKP
ncbi:GNAT family N-acetyltransferase [Streptomyces sp. NPDC088725]|uniref:GNAT family N-acetyltransferase n=1 Tax=Streptomyces sp. NPDC088725 TaxID=3365873 RepID=UPI0038192D09